MLRKFILRFEDSAPAALNWLRYIRHVVLAGNMTYPAVLGPIFKEMGASRYGAIDVGANTGIFTRYLGQRFAKTLAIEPHEDLARRLRSVAPGRVEPINAAAGSECGTLVLRTPLDADGNRMPALASASPDNHFDLFDAAGMQETSVPVRRLDDLTDGMPAIAFIKIDVEGFEDAVIEGAEALLLRDQPLVMIEICRAHNPKWEDVLARMERLGFKGYSVHRDGFRDTMRQAIASQPLHIDMEDSPTSEALDCDFMFVPPSKAAIVRKFVKAA